MTQPIYADAIANVSIVNGLARFDLVTASIEKEGEQQLKATPSGTLVLPLDGFIKLHSQIDGIVKKMVEDGILKPVDQNSPSNAIKK